MDTPIPPLNKSPAEALCDACGKSLEAGRPNEPFGCPRCGFKTFLAIMPNYSGVEEFAWYLHTDPEIRLLCRQCAWLGPLATLKRPRGY